MHPICAFHDTLKIVDVRLLQHKLGIYMSRVGGLWPLEAGHTGRLGAASIMLGDGENGMSVSSLDRSTTIGVVWRLTWGPILIAVAVVGLSLWLFWDGLWILGAWWTSDPEYSYCVRSEEHTSELQSHL